MNNIQIFSVNLILILLGFIGGILFEYEKLENSVVNSQTNTHIQSNNHNINFEHLENKLTVEDVDNTVTVYGSSMQPTFYSGHELLLEEYSNQKINEGDIVTFDENGNGLVTHRVDGIYTDSIYTKGDNNGNGEFINKNDIEYLVVGVLYTDE